MKKLFLFIVAASFANAMNAQVAVAAPVAAAQAIKFEQEVHDFGKIKQGVPVNYDFKFKNISKKPVTVENATASCGCTTPSWPKVPVMPKKSDAVKAGFNAAGLGTFEKTITVKLQGEANPIMIKIKGEVLSPEEFAKLPATKTK